MSQHHQQIRNDPRWKAARAACLERDDHACVRCGSGEELQVDHLVRLSVRPDLAFDLDNLQTLCHPCHIKVERERDQGSVEGRRRVRWINPRYAHLIPETAPNS